MTNALTINPSASAGSLLMDNSAMDRLERIADMMASGKATIPAHLRGSKADCFAVCLQSMQWGMNPFAVAQKTHLINGTLGYEAQLIAAVINTSGAVKTRFHFDFYGPWDRVIGKFTIEKGDKGEYRVPGWTLSDEEGCGVRISATLKNESEPRILDLLLAQARVRNSGLWADDPKQQLAYLGQKKWSRLFASDVILGVYDPEELSTPEPTEKHMGMVDEVGAGATAQTAALPAWDEQAWAATLPKILAGIAQGRTINDAIAWLSAKATVTQKQEDQLREQVAQAQAKQQQPEPTPQPTKPTQPANQAQQDRHAPAVDTEKLASQMKAAPTLDALYEASSLLDAVTDEAQRLLLDEIFDSRQAQLRNT